MDALLGFCLAELSQVWVVGLSIWVEVAGGREERGTGGPSSISHPQMNKYLSPYRAPYFPEMRICPKSIAGLGLFSLHPPLIGTVSSQIPQGRAMSPQTPKVGHTKPQ